MMHLPALLARAARRSRPSLVALGTCLLLSALVGSAGAVGEPDPCAECEPNSPPTVNLSANPMNPYRGQTVQFNAGGQDLDGDPLTYSWDTDGNGTFETPGTSTFSRTFSTLGTYTVGVQVSDGAATGSDTVQITVVNRSPMSLSFTYTPQPAKTYETVTFTASATDPDGDPLTYAWEWDGDDDFNDAFGRVVSRSWTIPGTYTVRVRASDPYGGSLVAGLSGNMPIANRTPTADFTYLPNGPHAGQLVTFDSSESGDMDGSIASRAWDLDGDGQYDDGTGVTATWTYTVANAHTVRLRVTDDRGATGTVSEVIYVDPAPDGDGDGIPDAQDQCPGTPRGDLDANNDGCPDNRPPTAAFTVSPSDPLVGQVVTLDSGPSSDIDGAIQSRVWDLDNDGAFDDALGLTVTRTFPAAGTYVVRLQVTDDDGATGTTSREVTVLADTDGDGIADSVDACRTGHAGALDQDADGCADTSGTDGPDRIEGTPGPDELAGLGGADELIGLGGKDTLDGGPGADTLDGGPGMDTLHGRGGKDRLVGGTGADTAYGHGGKDTLVGGSGNDLLYGGRNDDIITGGAGADTLAGGGGNDTLNARDGVAGDLVLCGGGTDTVTADPGDTIRPGCESITRQ